MHCGHAQPVLSTAAFGQPQRLQGERIQQQKQQGQQPTAVNTRMQQQQQLKKQRAAAGCAVGMRRQYSPLLPFVKRCVWRHGGVGGRGWGAAAAAAEGAAGGQQQQHENSGRAQAVLLTAAIGEAQRLRGVSKGQGQRGVERTSLRIQHRAQLQATSGSTLCSSILATAGQWHEHDPERQQ